MGKEFLNLGQVQQVKQNRKEKLKKFIESLQLEISQSTASPPAIPVEPQTEELDLSKEEALTENLFLTYMLLTISCEFYRGYNKC